MLGETGINVSKQRGRSILRSKAANHHQAICANQKVKATNHRTNRRRKKGKTVISANRGRAGQRIDGVVGAISFNAYETKKSLKKATITEKRAKKTRN
jgi:hypothetical protein